MIYLFVDTSINRLIISIIKDKEMIYYYNEENNTDLSSRTLPIIEKGFKQTNIDIKDVDTIFVVTGPGSFTGIRVGLTVAKTIGFALNKKVIPLSSLELLATTPFKDDYIVPVIDARRGYVYTGIYDHKLDNVFKDTYIEFSQLKKEMKNGNHILVSYDDYEGLKPDIDILKIVKKHKKDHSINPHQIYPNYLKLTEAEENLNRG